MKIIVLKIGIKKSLLIFIASFLFGITHQLISEEIYHWVKSDSIWKMNSSFPNYLDAKLLSSDRFITYSVDSIVRIWDLEGGNIIKSYNVFEKYDEIHLSDNGNYLILFNKIVYGYKFDYSVKIYTSIDFKSYYEFKIKDSILKQLFIGGDLYEIKDISSNFIRIDEKSNSIFLALKVSQVGQYKGYSVNGQNGKLLQIDMTNNMINIESDLPDGYITSSSFSDSLFHIITQSGVGYSGGKDSYGSYKSNYFIFDFNSRQNKKVDINIPNEQLLNSVFPDKISNKVVLSRFDRLKDYELTYFFYDFNIKTQSDIITLTKNYTPFFITPNQKYLIFHKLDFYPNDTILFFQPFSKKFEISIPMELYSNQNLLLCNDHLNYILHLLNSNSECYMRVYNLNKICNPLFVSEPTSDQMPGADELVIPDDRIVNRVKGKDSDLFPCIVTYYIEIQPSEGWQPSEGSNIQIFNTLGEIMMLVEQTPPSVHRINISNLTPGMYFIKIGNKVEKFVKM